MNKYLRNPIANIIGLSVFSAFYGIVFLFFSDLIQSQTGSTTHLFWKFWEEFLIAGGHRYIAYILLGLTICVVILLLFKRKPYDEYHTSILIKCLVFSLILTLSFFAVLFILVLFHPAGIISKFTFFIVVQWATVVSANFIFVLSCKNK